MYSKACLFRPSVTLAYNNIGQSDIRHGLTTNTPPTLEVGACPHALNGIINYYICVIFIFLCII